MQLILDCFKRIFESLAGVYTKAETDAQLAKRDSRIANAEENIGLNAQAIEQLDEALEANTANDNALANVVKWQSYAAAIQSAVDETTAAQIAEEFERATVEYLADPTATKEWVTTSATESTNPYFNTPPTKPVVDFNVTKAVGIRSRASFSTDTDQIMYFPNLESGFCMFYNCKKLSKWKSPLQSLTNGDSMFMYAGVVRFNTPMPKLTNGYRMFLGSKIEEFVGDLSKCTTLGGAFEWTPLSVFSSNLDSLSNASAGFTNTRLPAEQISKILDSLPKWTDGKNHIVAFTGSTGASELTQESPSVAAAIAKGWTVEL